MVLTSSSRQPRDPRVFPTTQLALLALVRVAEPIALTSIFPYAWKLVLHFETGDKSNASFYAGILISAFAFAESISGMFWGGLSDRYGRKPILLFGCAGTILSLLVVGFSVNFWMALMGRMLGGLLNGNIGVIQTMVGELVTLPEHEPRAYAIMPFVWSIGTIIGPALAGYFCNPSENFPTVFSPHGLFAKFPYLLPNVICASLLVVAILAGALAIEETHPDMQPWSVCATISNEASAHHPLLHPSPGNAGAAAGGAMEQGPADLTSDSYGTFNSVHVSDERHWTVKADGRAMKREKPTAFTRKVFMLTAALGIFTYHSMTYDHLLPIFLQDDRYGDLATISDQTNANALAGGLGLSIQQVGIIMSVNGIIALFVQGIIFPFFASWLGVWKIFLLVTFGHPIAYFIVPYLPLLPEGLLYPGIYTCLAVRNLLSILAYPVLLILIKEACPKPSYLGKINGLAASTGAACRTMASPVAGFLYGLGVKIDFTPLAWWASALVAIIGAIQTFFIPRQKNEVQVRGLNRIMSRDSLKESGNIWGPDREVVRITVETIPEESEGGSLEGSIHESQTDHGEEEEGDEEQGLLSGHQR